MVAFGLNYPSIGFATKGKQEAEAAISPEAGETALMESKQSSQANRYSKKKKTTTTKKSNRQYLYVSNSACSKEDRQELAIQSSKEILKEEDDEHAGRKTGKNLQEKGGEASGLWCTQLLRTFSERLNLRSYNEHSVVWRLGKRIVERS